MGYGSESSVEFGDTPLLGTKPSDIDDVCVPEWRYASLGARVKRAVRAFSRPCNKEPLFVWNGKKVRAKDPTMTWDLIDVSSCVWILCSISGITPPRRAY